MAYKEIEKEGTSYIEGRYEFVCDEVGDLANLPNNLFGAYAKVILDGSEYVQNSSGAWIKQGS